MRLGSMDRLQVWRVSRRLWNERPRVTVKLEQDLASMDQCNGEEQVRSRSMNQYGLVMIWSGSYHLVIGWCMCCINIEGDRMEYVTEPTNYTKLNKKITCRSRRFSKLKPVQPDSPWNHEGFQANSHTSQDRNKFSGHHHILHKSSYHRYIGV
jgi:hypothetical protein